MKGSVTWFFGESPSSTIKCNMLLPFSTQPFRKLCREMLFFVEGAKSIQIKHPKAVVGHSSNSASTRTRFCHIWSNGTAKKSLLPSRHRSAFINCLLAPQTWFKYASLRASEAFLRPTLPFFQDDTALRLSCLSLQSTRCCATFEPASSDIVYIFSSEAESTLWLKALNHALQCPSSKTIESDSCSSAR